MPLVRSTFCTVPSVAPLFFNFSDPPQSIPLALCPSFLDLSLFLSDFQDFVPLHCKRLLSTNDELFSLFHPDSLLSSSLSLRSPSILVAHDDAQLAPADAPPRPKTALPLRSSDRYTLLFF